MLKTKGYSDYVHHFLDECPNPEDSAPYFLSLLSVVEKSSADIEELDRSSGRTRRQLHANLTEAYDISYNDSLQEFELTTHTDNPMSNDTAGIPAAVPPSPYEAHDTQEVPYADPGWGTDQMWHEAWQGYDSHAYSDHDCT